MPRTGQERFPRLKTLGAEYTEKAITERTSGKRTRTAASEQAADALKGVEKRLVDMALFIKNISTYQKTKPTYDAYRAAKNEAHCRVGQERNIILHEAAARAIKAAGISGKLPSVTTLQAEYGKLQDRKKPYTPTMES